MTRSLSLLLLPLLATLLAACTTSAPPSGPDGVAGLPGVRDLGIPQASPVDDRRYRAIALDNGLRALLIQDADADKAAAALVVNVGSFHEPAQRAGIAHFLEHLLFLGTGKYPEPDAYSQFLATHGGRSNAYTSSDHTNYFFDVAPEQLEPTLDRFSRFFIDPLFAAAYVDREKNAVDSEYQMQSRNDGWRGFVVAKNALNPEHPASRFTIGTLETLADRPDSPLREAVIAFHDSHYSADGMTLVVLGREDTRTLARWVAEKFSAVPRRTTRSLATTPLYRSEDLPVLLRYRPVKEQRVATFSFAIPATDPLWQVQPDNYVANLLGHEGDGSLHAELTRRGWIEGLSAGGDRYSATDSTFQVRIQLTQAGLANLQAIGEQLFAYIATLRDRGVQAWRYREQADLAALGFRFQEQGSPMQTVYSLAAGSLTYPLDAALRGPYAMDRFDAEAIDALLAALTPERVQLNVTDPDAPTDTTDPWFGVEYSLAPLPAAWLQRWQAPQPSPALALPVANPFIPEDLELVAGGDPVADPQRLAAADLELWHSIDTSFGVPRANLWLKLASPLAESAGPREAALTVLLTRMVEDQLNARLYPARLAGLGYNLQAHNQGLLVSVGGYSDKQAVLLADLLAALANAPLAADRHAVLREELVRTWRNSVEDKPFQRTLAGVGRAVQTRDFDPLVMADALAATSLDDLQAWRQAVLARLHASMLVHGNHSTADALALATAAGSGLLENATPAPDVAPRQVLPLDAGRQVQRLEPTHPDAAMTLYVQGGAPTPAARALDGLLGDMLGTPYFNTLRTEQQLGYVVFAGNRTYRNQPGLFFTVQSPKVGADELYARTIAFLDAWSGTLAAMPEAEFEAARDGFLTKLLEQPRNLTQRGQRWWRELELDATGFDTRERIAAAARALDKAAVQARLAQVRRDVEERALLVVTEGRFAADSVAGG